MPTPRHCAKTKAGESGVTQETSNLPDARFSIVCARGWLVRPKRAGAGCPQRMPGAFVGRLASATRTCYPREGGQWA